MTNLLRLSRTPLFSLTLVLCLTVMASAQSSPDPARTRADERATAAINKLPLRFEPTNHKGVFLARGMGQAVQLTGASIDFPLGSASRDGNSIRLQFVGARKSSRLIGVDQLPGRVNYLYGDDPARWRTNIPTYARARTSSLYRGIDVEYYGTTDKLEYDFIVKPGANPQSIRLSIMGASASINDDGDLVSGHRVLLRRPVAYQVIDGDRRSVSVDYRRRADESFGFTVGAYDRRQPLVIDPIVQYSFTFGGSGRDVISDLAVDETGAVYVGGSTYSADFPTVNPAGGRQDAGAISCWGGENFSACSDGMLAKVRPDGTSLDYATYFGVVGADAVSHIDRC